MTNSPSHLPLHLQVAERIRRDIADLEPGTKLWSEAALARRLDVSVFTVREALSLLAVQGYVERRPRSGTYVGNHRQRQAVGILCGVDITHPRASYFYRRLVHRLRTDLEDLELPVRIYIGRAAPGSGDGLMCNEFWEDVAEHRLAAAVRVATPQDDQWTHRLDREGVAWFPRPNGFEVWQDYPGLIREGLAYLRDNGCRRIAVVGWPGVEAAAGSRLRDLRASLEAEMDPKRFKTDLRIGSTGAGWDAVMELWTGSTDKPDGLLVCDDVLFSEAAQGLAALGVRVPEDLLVASHATAGDSDLVPFPMLRLEFNADEHARLLAEHVAAVVSGRTPEPRRVTLPCRRVHVEQRRPVRETSG